jgi:hypothetical protein
VIDRKHLGAAIQLATSQRTDVFHLSCHGDEEGIELCDGEAIGWSVLAGYFQSGPYCPEALVMSACCGASAGIAEQFAKRNQRPTIIFGTTEARSYSQFAVAWSILYRRFKIGGVRRKAAQAALKDICAVVDPSFMYRGWDTKEDDYIAYPEDGTTYGVMEQTAD